jgi:hypothetical protein
MVMARYRASLSLVNVSFGWYREGTYLRFGYVVNGTWKPKHVGELISTIKTAYEHLLDISHLIPKQFDLV